MALTPKQARFVEEYLVDLNATQAAIRAGYSERTANEQGARLLAHVSVSAAVQEAQAARSKRTEITQDRVLLELARIAFSDVLNHYEADEMGRVTVTEDAPEGASAAVSSVKRKVRTFTDSDDNTETTVEVEYKVWDKNTALANLGRHLGLFVDRTEVTGKNGEPLFKVYVGVDTDRV